MKIEDDVKVASSTTGNTEQPVTDVTSTDSSAEEQEQVESEESPESQSESQSSAPTEVKDEGMVKDDRPIQNVAWEAKRKIDELYTTLPEMIRTTIQEHLGKSQETPQYTKAQLQAYIQSGNANDQQRIWALEEIDKIDKVERRKEMEELFNGFTAKTQKEIKAKESTQYIVNTFPECFRRDGSGNIIDWDNSNPLTQKIGEYMRQPEFRDHPQGLVAAAKMAAFDLGYSMSKKLQNKVAQTTAQLKREQKKTLISSGGTTVNQDENRKTRVQKLADTYRKTGDKEIFKQLAKARGLIPEL
jgi:hypothetical protein